MPRRPSLLEAYNAKRDFTRTEEPRGRAEAGSPMPRFVVQKHDARRLHFDLRLEIGGVLKSWAVTRGPSLDPSEKRLAVRTEDHPIEYARFEGTIPKGEYGGGTVMVWDSGTWQTEGDAVEAIERGLLKFELRGRRLKGGFALIRLGKKPRDMRENWLLVKERDAFAERDGEISDRFLSSVASGRAMEAIAAGNGEPQSAARRGRRAPRRQHKASAGGDGGADQGESDGEHRGAVLPPPAFVAPQLAKLASEPPAGDEWLHEIKFDGYRALAAIGGGDVRLFTRSGLDWTEKFHGIADGLRSLNVKSALIDGEVVVLDDKGRSDFGRLQEALKDGGEALVYFAFDLIELDGRDLRGEPLRARKETLRTLLAGVSDTVRVSGHVAGHGAAVLAEACKLGLEGIVSKRADGRYISARTRSWIKTKCLGRDEFVIVGFRRSDKRGRPFSSLILGEYVAGRLAYRGRVGTGFDDAELGLLARKLVPAVRKDGLVQDVPREIARDASWVEPRLVAEIHYTERTKDGVLRHPTYIGLREDKRPEEVVMAQAAPVGKARSSDGASEMVDGVRISSPDKVLFSGAKASKRDLARYYLAAASFLLPHVKGRPLSFVRCPEGNRKGCFFQKHHALGFPPELASVEVRESDGELANYVAIDTRRGFVAAAQVGALELHIWGARADAIEKPDRIVLDLDPDESLPFAEVRRAAFDVRELLKASGLETFPLLTGGKGIHVVAPIERRLEWPAIKQYTKGFAVRLARDDPERFVANMSKAKRRGRIFIDYLRNERGSTAIAPYSMRAKPNASVAMPVSWEELRRIEHSDQFTMAKALERIGKGHDAWEGYFDVRQRIPASALKFFGT